MKEGKIMEYTKLGNTEIEISKLCVGYMSFGKAEEGGDAVASLTDNNAVRWEIRQGGLAKYNTVKALVISSNIFCKKWLGKIMSE